MVYESGKPDIVFRKQKVAVFCDSAFWHGKDAETEIERIKTNKDYWARKIRRNIERDGEVTDSLENAGWKVIRIWDDEIKRCLDSVIGRITAELMNEPTNFKSAIRGEQ